MWKLQSFKIVLSQFFLKIIFGSLFLSAVLAYWIWNQRQYQSFPTFEEELDEFQQERFWFDLVVRQNISVLRQLPSHVLRSDQCFWKAQLDRINEESNEKKVETLSKIMQFQMEKAFNDVDCSNRLTLSCGHQGTCGFGCQLHHRSFCVLVSFTLGIPLIHNESDWPFKSPWGSIFKRLGSKCNVNDKTIFMTYSATELPVLRFSTLCSENSCVHNRTVHLKLDQGIPITTELLDLLRLANHNNPFLWYMGQFVRYALRLNYQTKAIFEEIEYYWTFHKNPPVIGIQARRTDKQGEAKDSHHSVTEYMQIVKVYFQFLINRHDPKTVFVASDDHTVLAEVQQSYKLPEWKILGFASNYTMFYQHERASGFALMAVISDIHFLSKCDYMICGLSSNVCRLVLEIMATRFQNPNSRLYCVDGVYGWPMWNLNLNMTLIPI